MEAFEFGKGEVLIVSGVSRVGERAEMHSIRLHHTDGYEVRNSTQAERDEYQRTQPRPDAVLLFPTAKSVDTLISMLSELREELNN